MHPSLPRRALLAAFLVAACGTGSPPASTAGAAGATATTSIAATSGPTEVPATPMATALADTPALGLKLPGDTFPIDLAFGFGSLWLAAHHLNQVYRMDPATMAITARIDVGNGPGWFAVTDDAVWVTLQLGRGMTRIDPKTNTADTRVGMWPPCGSPVIALGSIFQMGCDAHQLMRIDPVARTVKDLTVTDYQWPAFVDGQLVMAGDNGLARIDPSTGAATPIPGAPGGFLTGYDEHTVWLSDEKQVRRVTPADGKVVATLPVTFGGMVRTFGDHAWMIQESTAAMRIDTAASKITRTIPILYGPVVALEAAGHVWVTTMDGNMLWRIDL